MLLMLLLDWPILALSRAREMAEQNASDEEGDDRDDDHQFDEGESAL